MQQQRIRIYSSVTPTPDSTTPTNSRGFNTGTHKNSPQVTSWAKVNSSPANFNKTKRSPKSELIKKKNTSHNALPQLKQYQSTRSNRWDMLSEDVCRPDLQEENEFRNPRIKELLKEFMDVKNKLVNAFEKEKVELMSKIFSISEAILDLYKIGLNIVTVTQVDSALELGPITNKFDILRGFLYLIPEICRFPYSFFVKIDFLKISFYGSLKVFKNADKQLVDKKLLNGVFPMGNLTTDEQIANHFYKTLLFHIRTVMPEIDEELLASHATSAKLILTLNKSADFSNSDPTRTMKKVYGNLDDYGRLLKKLIAAPVSVIHSESELVSSKGRILKDILQKIDPYGITRKFWLQSGYNREDDVLLSSQGPSLGVIDGKYLY